MNNILRRILLTCTFLFDCRLGRKRNESFLWYIEINFPNCKSISRTDKNRRSYFIQVYKSNNKIYISWLESHKIQHPFLININHNYTYKHTTYTSYKFKMNMAFVSCHIFGVRYMLKDIVKKDFEWKIHPIKSKEKSSES